jgi:hypothetical protein
MELVSASRLKLAQANTALNDMGVDFAKSIKKSDNVVIVERLLDHFTKVY